MANLNDLPLNAETIEEVDVESVPLFGGFTPPPQPGTYVVRLPASEILFNCFEVEETGDQGQRLRAIFNDVSALWNESLNQPYNARVSSRVRFIKVNDPENPGQKKDVGISDFAQLLRVVGSLPEGKTNQAYGAALTKAGGRRFTIEHALTARCDPKRDIYKDGQIIKGKKGCGAKYASEVYKGVSPIPKDEDGFFQTRFICGNTLPGGKECGAELRAWGQIRSFRTIKDKD